MSRQRLLGRGNRGASAEGQALSHLNELSGDRIPAITGLEDKRLYILQNHVSVLTAEHQEEDEGQGTAEALAVFEVSVGTGIHHETFGEFGLGKMLLFPCLGKALGHVGSQFAFTSVLHGYASLSHVLSEDDPQYKA